MHSRSLEAARRRSNPPTVSFSCLKGEGQLAKAAAYIQERLTKRSSACNEFISWTPRVPLDKKAEHDTPQQVIDIVSENERTSASSPEPLMESMLLCCPQVKAVPSPFDRKLVTVAWPQLEVPRADKLSTESPQSTQTLTGFKHKTPDDRGWECSSMLSVEVIEVSRRSYERLLDSKELAVRELVFPALTEDERSFWNTKRQHTYINGCQ